MVNQLMRRCMVLHRKEKELWALSTTILEKLTTAWRHIRCQLRRGDHRIAKGGDIIQPSVG